MLEMIDGITDVQGRSTTIRAGLDENPITSELDRIPDVGQAGLVETSIFLYLFNGIHKGRIVQEVDELSFDSRAQGPVRSRSPQIVLRLDLYVLAKPRKDKARP